MRRLILLRHAKTETDAPSGRDQDRRLDDRGRADAVEIAGWLTRNQLLPDAALVSTAVRARQTWDILAALIPESATQPEVSHLEELYGAGAAQMLQEIHNVSGAPQRLLLVGHNPGLQELALGLTCKGDAAERKALSGNMPTSGLVVLEFAIADWADASFGGGKLSHFVSPKILRAAS
jgi:phosphohistidine phosphatase